MLNICVASYDERDHFYDCVAAPSLEHAVEIVRDARQPLGILNAIELRGFGAPLDPLPASAWALARQIENC